MVDDELFINKSKGEITALFVDLIYWKEKF